MQFLPNVKIVAALVAGLLVGLNGSVGAITIAHNGDSVDIEFVDIGNTNVITPDPFLVNAKGVVTYDYSIGKFEVTSNQWAAVSSYDNRIETNTNNPWTGYQPTANTSWYEAARFANWLTSGDALLGAYTFSDANTFTEIDRASALTTYGTIYAIPTENEWYKAAYLKSDGSGYTLYPTGDSPPIAGIDANYNGVNSSPWNVGSGSIENNGTYDMGGNVMEWNEANINGGRRGMRGGHWYRDSVFLTPTSRAWLGLDDPLDENEPIGFRLVSLDYQPDIDLSGATAQLEYLWDGAQGKGRGGLPPGLTPFKGTIEVSSFDLGGNDYATLQWAYDEIDLSLLRISEETLRLYWYDEANNMWVEAGEASNNTPNGGQFVLGGPTTNLGDWGLDIDNNFAWANIDHASEYALVGLSLNFVPEPTSTALLALGGLAVMMRRRR